jgi:integrase
LLSGRRRPVASLELRNKTYRVVFMHGGRKYGFSLDTGDKPTAEALRGGVEKTLMLIGQGVLRVPDGGDVVAFIRNGGKPEEATSRPAAPVTFAVMRDRYLAAHGTGAMEANSLATVELHLKHVGETLGERFPVAKLTPSDLQRHVDRRRGKKSRGKGLSPVTLRKEISSLRAVWNWAAAHGLVAGTFPSKGLVYPKTDEKPPFMTLNEVERKIAAGGLSAAAIEELSESLYLRREEVDELLEYVRAHAAHPWIYPLVCTAAHTGARRSELLRAEVADVDLAAGVLLIREKKRSKRQRTTRHVSLTPLLAQVLRDWLAAHPGGRFLFCQAGVVGRSKKRSRTTGHRGDVARASTLTGRLAGVRPRPAAGAAPVTRDEAHDHLKRTLAGSRWEVLRGFHVLRHSFISCLAAAGIDQRVIDEFVGHQTDEQRKRYRHLTPDVKRRAIASAFG